MTRAILHDRAFLAILHVGARIVAIEIGLFAGFDVGILPMLGLR